MPSYLRTIISFFIFTLSFSSIYAQEYWGNLYKPEDILEHPELFELTPGQTQSLEKGMSSDNAKYDHDTINNLPLQVNIPSPPPEPKPSPPSFFDIASQDHHY